MSNATLFQFGDDGSRTLRSEIGEEPVVVGRSRQAKVNVEDEGVSRRHFVILREGEDYVIKDLSSRNGTWVDGRRVFAVKLHHNDWILAGQTLFLFASQVADSTAPGASQTGPHGTVMLSPPRSASA
jgi:pSer/pThr/pTyr-binding forkhead associated (FHA) protein